MGKYAINLPALQRRVTIRQYLTAFAAAKANPDRTFKSSFEDWVPAKGSEIRREFVAGVHDRINRHMPFFRQGRKWAPDHQRQMQFAAHQLNTPRLIVHWLPAELRKRFSHRLPNALD